MAGFLRRILQSLDFEHEQNRIERNATVFAAPIGPKPTRQTHAD